MSSGKTCVNTFFAALLAVCLLPSGARAQAVGGTILGSVKDASGGAISGAVVTISSNDTGLKRALITDASGEYVAPSLPPGAYSVTAEMAGFKKVSVANVGLGVDQKARVDLSLEVGQVTESINVEASVPLVQSDSRRWAPR